MQDCVRQLEDANTQIWILQEDLRAKSDVNTKLQDDVTNLHGRTIALEAQISRVSGIIKGLLERVNRKLNGGMEKLNTIKTV